MRESLSGLAGVFGLGYVAHREQVSKESRDKHRNDPEQASARAWWEEQSAYRPGESEAQRGHRLAELIRLATAQAVAERAEVPES